MGFAKLKRSHMRGGTGRIMVHRVAFKTKLLLLLLILHSCVLHDAMGQTPVSCAKRASNYNFHVDNSMTWDPLSFKLLDNFMIMTDESTVRRQPNTLPARTQWYTSAKGIYQEIQRAVGCNLLVQEGESYALLRAKALTCVCMSFRQHLHQVLRANFDCALQSSVPDQYSIEYLQLANRVNLILRMRMLAAGVRVVNWYDALYDHCLLQFVKIDSSHEEVDILPEKSHRGKTRAYTQADLQHRQHHLTKLTETPAPTVSTPMPSQSTLKSGLVLSPAPQPSHSKISVIPTLPPRHPSPTSTPTQSHWSHEGSNSSSSSGQQGSVFVPGGSNDSVSCNDSKTVCIPEIGSASISASAGSANSPTLDGIIEAVDSSESDSASAKSARSSISSTSGNTIQPPETGSVSMISPSTAGSTNMPIPESDSSLIFPSPSASEDSSHAADGSNIPETDPVDTAVSSSDSYTFVTIAALVAIGAVLTGSLLLVCHKSRSNVVSPMAQYSRLDQQDPDEYE